MREENLGIEVRGIDAGRGEGTGSLVHQRTRGGCDFRFAHHHDELGA